MHRFDWYRPALIRVAALAVVLLSIGALGCPKQEDLPAAPEIVVPPTPANFVVTLTAAQLNPPAYTYDFTWTVSDPTNIDHYRLYVLGGGFVPDQLLFEPTTTSFSNTFTYSLTGLQFAVSGVSAEGVEGVGRTTNVR